MRIFFTSLFAFFISGLAGGLIAQWLAVATGAEEEYIIVFMVSVLVTFVVTFIFFVAQLMNDPVAAVSRAGKWTLIVFVALIVLLVGVILYSDSSAAVVRKDMPMVAGLGLPGLVTIIIHWLFVRWRVKRGVADIRRVDG
ncbi:MULTISPECIES: hypothetical protein [unclassified Mesorhizobium]|uniref:hypothetical protein n=1 Tax=unclassified Mesorhizobium TaxID=325217 RepID=UPI001CCF08F6|nr:MULTISPECIES: hypothetical protein [unclassified Mesorhizobium]MBZ9740510.1 hypothetical protein [Mesorhizobium sp. CO1-1-4]MBZ9800503.1 hypothetical protein [Mesorhizobium sp. ES1-6]